MDSKITFSFGKNWMDYNRTVTQKEIDKAERIRQEYFNNKKSK